MLANSAVFSFGIEVFLGALTPAVALLTTKQCRTERPKPVKCTVMLRSQDTIQIGEGSLRQGSLS